MPNITNWLESLCETKPELSTFIGSVKKYFSDSGFNSVEFEKAVEKGLSKKEENIKLSLTSEDNA